MGSGGPRQKAVMMELHGSFQGLTRPGITAQRKGLLLWFWKEERRPCPLALLCAHCLHSCEAFAISTDVESTPNSSATVEKNLIR